MYLMAMALWSTNQAQPTPTRPTFFHIRFLFLDRHFQLFGCWLAQTPSSPALYCIFFHFLCAVKFELWVGPYVNSKKEIGSPCQWHSPFLLMQVVFKFLISCFLNLDLLLIFSFYVFHGRHPCCEMSAARHWHHVCEKHLRHQWSIM